MSWQNETLLNEAGGLKNLFGNKVNNPQAVKADWRDVIQAAKDQINGGMDLSAGKLDDVNDSLGNLNDTLGKLNSSIINKDNYFSSKSIIARSKNSVMQFPVYITQGIRVNEAHIIAKLFERVYASFVQNVLAMNPMIEDEKSINNLVFLKKFHSNINESKDFEVIGYNEFYQPIDEMDEMLKESVFYRTKVTPTMEATFRMVPLKDKFLISESARLAGDPLEGFSYLKEGKDDGLEVKETTVNGTKKHISLSDNDLRDMAIEMNDVDDDTKKYADMAKLGSKEIHDKAIDDAHLSSDERKYMNKTDDEIRGDIVKAHPNMDNKDIDREYNVRRKIKNDAIDKVKDAESDLRSNIRSAVNEIDGYVNDLKQQIKDDKLKGLDYKNGKYFRADVTSSTVTKKMPKTNKAPDVIKAVDAPKFLRDVEIKKLNGMLPYSIEASFRIMGKRGADGSVGLDRDVHFIIGIKTVMHLIKVQDLQEELRELITGNMKSLQKVRYKTGEISFLDYLLNPKAIKRDASKSVNYNKKWISNLKRLAEWTKLNGTVLKPATFFNKGEVPIPNGTLVLSHADVASLTDKTGIDISSLSNAKRLCKSLFLIAIAIVDGSAGTMRVFFPDRDTDWDVQSLASIDAELAKTDNSPLMNELKKSAMVLGR